jgi:hypothetical protein
MVTLTGSKCKAQKRCNSTINVIRQVGILRAAGGQLGSRGMLDRELDETAWGEANVPALLRHH